MGNKLQELDTAEAELVRKEAERLQAHRAQREKIRALGGDLNEVWAAPTTTDRDRKELLRSLMEEVKIKVHSDPPKPNSWHAGRPAQ